MNVDELSFRSYITVTIVKNPILIFNWLNLFYFLFKSFCNAVRIIVVYINK